VVERCWLKVAIFFIYSLSLLHNNPLGKSGCKYFRAIFSEPSQIPGLASGFNSEKVICLLTAKARYRQTDGHTDRQTASDLNSGQYYVTLAKNADATEKRQDQLNG